MPENDNRSNDGGKKKAGKGRGPRTTLTIIVVLAAVTIVGFIGYFISWQYPQTASNRSFVSYPTVSSTVSSSRDGKQHSIDIDLVVEYADGNEEGISHDAVYRDMSKTIGSLDYDDLKQPSSVEYIESAVQENLSAVTGSGRVSRVYVNNIAIDFPGEVNNTRPPSSGPSTNERLKGLFPNIQN